jgi:hypothetical protein
MRSHTALSFWKGIIICSSLLVLSSCETDYGVSKVYHGLASQYPLTQAPSGSSSSDPSSNQVPSPSSTPVCSTVLETTQQNLRIMFMMDNSGSTDVTDPDKYYRVKTVKDFLQTYSTKQNFSYSFAWFSDTAKVVQSNPFKVVSTTTQPFGDASFLSQALTTYSTYSNGGGTQYFVAFNTLQSMIINDATAASQWNYVIVFLSDGQPTDVQTNDQLTTAVNSLKATIAAKGHLLTMSTVYFGPASGSDPTADQAISRLTAMAQAGNGQFLDTNQTGGVLNIGDVITVPGQVCNTTK